MKGQELGNIISRINKLEEAVFGRKAIKSKKATLPEFGDINFSLNERAFVKRFASKKSGPKKITLLLAFLAKGSEKKEIPLNIIEKHWGKMKSLLGKFNRYYANEAKTQGLIHSNRYGHYNLTNEWKNAI